VISAKFWVSNRVSYSGPPSAAKAAMSQAFSAVTHPSGIPDILVGDP